MFASLGGHPSITIPTVNSSKMMVFPKGESSPLSSTSSVTKSFKRSNDTEDKMAKLLRERSTAQKRRQSKREELGKLGATIQELESKLAKLRTRVDSLSEPERQQIAAAQARAGSLPLGCRLCSILERREEYATIDRLVHHFRVHHASDLRQRGDDFELQSFATEIPSEESADMSDNEDGNMDSDDDTPEELVKSNSVDSLPDTKRKLRLKRNAASARKSRKRKRVQLERWRMILPGLRFQVETLETALASVRFPASTYQFDAEPDVVSAAFALIGCSLSAAKTTT